jgi:hypothetical protein
MHLKCRVLKGSGRQPGLFFTRPFSWLIFTNLKQVYARRHCVSEEGQFSMRGKIMEAIATAQALRAVQSPSGDGQPNSQTISHTNSQTNSQPKAPGDTTLFDSPEPRILRRTASPSMMQAPLAADTSLPTFRIPTTDSGIVSDSSRSPTVSPDGLPPLLHVTTGLSGHPFYQVAYPGLPAAQPTVVTTAAAIAPTDTLLAMSPVDEESAQNTMDVEAPLNTEMSAMPCRPRAPLVEELGPPPTSRRFPLRPRERYTSGIRLSQPEPDLLFILPTYRTLSWNRHLFFDNAWRVLETCNMLRARTLLMYDISMLRVFSARCQHDNASRRRRRYAFMDINLGLDPASFCQLYVYDLYLSFHLQA